MMEMLANMHLQERMRGEESNIFDESCREYVLVCSSETDSGCKKSPSLKAQQLSTASGIFTATN